MERRSLRREDYTVGWVCALPIELAAAELMLDTIDENKYHIENHHNLYTFGCIGDHNVVIACLPVGQTGTNSAAAVAAEMRSTFTSLRFGLMVGIGGGVPSNGADIRLGDVVISKPENQHGGVIQYDLGKTTPDGFLRTGYLNTPPSILLQALTKMQANHVRGSCFIREHMAKFSCLPAFARESAGPDILFDPTYGHAGGDQCNMCSEDRQIKRKPRMKEDIILHYGTIASGNQVMRDGAIRDKVNMKLGGVLCFEMEAAGLMNNFPCLIIRGICDYADSHKNKQWQPYAAAVAAACAKEVLTVVPAAKATTKTPTNQAGMHEMLQSAINELNVEQFSKIIPRADQDLHMSSIPLLNPEASIFHWVFKNLEFQHWNSVHCSQMTCCFGPTEVLCLAGPLERKLCQISSYIVQQEKLTDHIVLYFFCPAAPKENSISTSLFHTLLEQIIHYSPTHNRILIIRNFLNSLLHNAFREEADIQWKDRGFDSEKPLQSITRLFDTTAKDLVAALTIALRSEEQRGITIIIDGLDKVEHQRIDFMSSINVLIDALQERNSHTKILLTGEPLDDVMDLFNRFRCIQLDKERRNCLASLAFDNTRYEKISEEHKGSCEWIWAHKVYQEWSTSTTSHCLYIEGKPGSGKSTLTKYFNYNLSKRDASANQAIVAGFFYSFREGELQRSHFNMLLSILHEILYQEENFFYHQFQTIYRDQHRRGDHTYWDYKSLKRVLQSLQDYSETKRLYLIIDAIDESDESDRRDILDLFLDVCANMKYCLVKVFIASRPIAQLEVRRHRIHHFIKLQDETRSALTSYTESLLKDLHVSSLLAEASDYIVQHAQGVFMWVKLIGQEVLTCYEEDWLEEDVWELIKALPKELEYFYEYMLRKMKDNKPGVFNGIKIFRLVIFAIRPLTVEELVHALAIPDSFDHNQKSDLSDDSFQKSFNLSEQRIMAFGGNFLEIKQHSGKRTVQVMHQTVREFFLKDIGCVAASPFGIFKKDAHTHISILCLRYLLLCAATTSLVEILPEITSWTWMHFQAYTQYLEKRPLAVYALCHIKHHIDAHEQDTNVDFLTSQLIQNPVKNPGAYLLETWTRLRLGNILLSNERRAISRDVGDWALRAAVVAGFPIATEVLLAAGMVLDARDSYGRTPLSWAAENGHEIVVKLLLDKGAGIENKGKTYERTPLLWAAESGHESVSRILLDYDANIEARDKDGETPLYRAAALGHQAIVRVLLQSNANIEARDKDGETPLYRAAALGHEAIVRVLLQSNANIEARDKDGETPLYRAAALGHETIVRVLLQSNANIKARYKGGEMPLCRAAARGHEAIVRLLLQSNSNIEANDGCHRTPLWRAAARGYTAIVKLLVEKGANMEAKDKDGQTPLWRAAARKHEAVVRLLLENGADIEAKEKDGQTSLWRAAKMGHESVVRLLVEKGAAVDARDKDDQTPLWRAVMMGHGAIVNILLQNGANIEARDKYGRTPLLRAAEIGNEVMVRLLLDNGAKAEVEDNYLRTPIGLAAQSGHEVIVSWLSSIS